MICLGLDNQKKTEILDDCCQNNDIKKIFILSPEKFVFKYSDKISETVTYNDLIEYRFFYRLLQEIDKRTLVVVNECLRTKNRYELTFNCIRHFLNQAGHRLIFQYLPIIENREDFMILFDFDTRSQWKRRKFDPLLFKYAEIRTNQIKIKLDKIYIETSRETKEKYLKEKKYLFENIGIRDPHTIPRNLYMLSGKDKLRLVEKKVSQKQFDIFSLGNSKIKYIGRNNRFKIENMEKYKQSEYSGTYSIFEFCHNHIDLIDFFSLSKQTELDVLISDLKVDKWYWDRYSQWIQELNYVYSKLQ